MAIIIDEVQLFLLIPKIIEAILFFIISFKIRKLKDTLLNKLFSAALLSWSIYLLLDGTLYPIAASNYTFYLLGTIGWAIQLVCLMIFTFFIFLASKVIRDGQSSIREHKVILPNLVLFIIFGILLVLNIPISVFDGDGNVIPPTELPPTGNFQVTQNITMIGGLIAGFPILFYFITVKYMLDVIKKVEDPIKKKKMRHLIVGIIFVPLSLIYFIIRSIFMPTFDIWTSIPGHIMWLSAPFIIYRAL